MTTPILNITEISGNQQNQYITANEAFRALEASTNEFLAVDLSGSDVTLTEAQFTAAYAFVGTGHTLTRALILPASKRAFVVRNAGTQDIIVTLGTSTVIIPVDKSFLLMTDGTANGLFNIANGASGGGTIWGSITGDINDQADLLAIFTAMGNSVLSTGVTSYADTIGLIALNDTTLRFKPVVQAVFYNLIPLGIPNALRSFAQIDYPLAGLPGIVTDGIYVIFVGVNEAGTVITSAQSFTLDESTLQYGYIIVKRVAGVNSFLDGAVGPRNVYTWPDFAGDNASINEFLTPRSTVSIIPNAALTVQNSAGVIKGLAINWGTSNVNQRTKTSANPTSVITVNPSTALAASLPAPGTAIQVTQYWNGAAMTTMAGANNASVQRFLITIAGTIFLQVGELQYTTLDAAADAIGAAPFSNLLPDNTAVELCRFASRRGATNLSDGADAIFSYGSGTASGGTGGAGTNLNYVASPTDGLIQSSTGSSATVPLSTGVNAGLMSPANTTKLAGINIGTGAADVPNNTQLNVRLGTSGNLGTLAQQNVNAVAISGGTVAGLSSLGVDGDITFTGNGRKLLAQMSDGTVSNNLTIQTTTSNGNSILNIAPAGTGQIGGLNLHNASDILNSSYLGFGARPAECRISVGTLGTGVLVPLLTRMGAITAQAISTVGDVGFGVASPTTACKLQVSNGISVGNTVNANATVLDWYEKGSFTPVAIGTTTAGVGTYTVQSGSYKREGNTVTFRLAIGWTAHTGTGNLSISDLPFASASSGAPVPSMIYCDGLVVGAGKTPSSLISSSQTSITLRAIDPAGGASSLIPMDTTVTVINISGVYFV